jgi:hypothetical protein
VPSDLEPPSMLPPVLQPASRAAVNSSDAARAQRWRLDQYGVIELIDPAYPSPDAL